MISTRANRFITVAAQIAEKSSMLHQHGCVAVAAGKIIGTGYNDYRNYSRDGIIGHSCSCSCHAEIAAIRSVTKNKAKYQSSIKVGQRQSILPKVV